ncbi:MAG: response regulator transcription factor [Candidatus Ancillula sp.]|nr:response regulator transcription factor [Candidatus Ancillula sp.]
MSKILVADDETDITELVQASLEFAGFEVECVRNGEQVIDKLNKAKSSGWQYDLIILDVMMAPLGGFDTLKEMRRLKFDVPVVFLTAKDFDHNVVEGLSLGADDYIAKPFAMEVLIARINTVLRRANPNHITRSSNAQVNANDDEVYIVHDLVLNARTHDVSRDNVPISLTPTEYEILEYLLRNMGRIVSKQELNDQIWHGSPYNDLSIVETYVSTLRKKLNANGRGDLIETKRGFGYLIRESGGGSDV